MALPDIKVDQPPLDLKKLDPTQHFTKPAPPRYTEAAWSKSSKSRGGSAGVHLCLHHFYYSGSGGLCKASESPLLRGEDGGEIVTERLAESFPNLMDYDFTARLEDELDEIAEGEVQWKKKC